MNVIATAKIIAARTRFLFWCPSSAVVIPSSRVVGAVIVAHGRNNLPPRRRAFRRVAIRIAVPGRVSVTVAVRSHGLRSAPETRPRAAEEGAAGDLLGRRGWRRRGLALVAAPLPASAGTPAARRARTARCSPPTTCGTPTSRRCRSTPTAPSGWPAWTAPPPTCTRTSGPRATPAPPTAFPYTVVSPSQPADERHLPVRHESDPGPYPFGPDTPIEGGAQSTGDRHALMVNPSTCTLYELYDAQYSAVGLDRGLRGDLEPQLERPAAQRLDLGRRRRPADPARAAALRRGAVGRHHPRHPHDGRVDGQRVHLAGPPCRGQLPTIPTFPRWGPASG